MTDGLSDATFQGKSPIPREMPRSELILFRFRVSGIEDNTVHRRNYIVPAEDVFEIEAESVGDALNELVNRSGMWETIDMDSDFTIEFLSGEVVAMREP